MLVQNIWVEVGQNVCEEVDRHNSLSPLSSTMDCSETLIGKCMEVSLKLEVEDSKNIKVSEDAR
jgi:hypothetical protein